MRVVMVSDAHLVDQHDPVQASWVSWLDTLEADELVLLGDIFHTWWGHWKTLQPEYQPAIEALRRVRDRGISIRMVPGNHDFALGKFFQEELGAEIRGPHATQFSGYKFFVAHGDEVDRSHGYRLASAILRGTPFRALMGALGPRRGTSLLQWLAGSSRAHNPNPGPLLEAQHHWARQLHTEGAQVVVMGHLHCPAIESWESGCFVQLGDWVEHRSWLVVQESGLELFCLDGEDQEPRSMGRWSP